MIYGLQCLREKDAGYLDILTTMSKIADTTMKDHGAISAQNMSMMLYGLQENRFMEPESKHFLTVTTK